MIGRKKMMDGCERASFGLSCAVTGGFVILVFVGYFLCSESVVFSGMD
jgi:hypothetical protein